MLEQCVTLLTEWGGTSRSESASMGAKRSLSAPIFFLFGLNAEIGHGASLVMTR